MPTSPKTPATNACPTSGSEGNGSPRGSAGMRAAIAPAACVTATTASTRARRVTRPPPKSPVPQLRAEARPRTTTATSGARSTSGRLLERRVAVDRGRPIEHDHLVGLPVVAVRRRQVDHLEVAGDLAQQPARPRG